MKQLYYRQKQWKFTNEKEWRNLYSKDMCYGEMPETVEETFRDFQFAVDTYDGHSTRPFIHYTLFRQKPRIILYNDPLNWSRETKLTARNFKPFTVRWHYEPVEHNPTMKQLMEELNARELINYCKDNGLEIKIGD